MKLWKNASDEILRLPSDPTKLMEDDTACCCETNCCDAIDPGNTVLFATLTPSAVNGACSGVQVVTLNEITPSPGSGLETGVGAATRVWVGVVAYGMQWITVIFAEYANETPHACCHAVAWGCSDSGDPETAGGQVLSGQDSMGSDWESGASASPVNYVGLQDTSTIAGNCCPDVDANYDIEITE
jgi:hypothetical protein